MMWAGWGLVPLMMLFFWILIIVGVVLVVRAWWGPRGRGAVVGDRALQIVRERYARGEITREQLEEMSQELTRR